MPLFPRAKIWPLAASPFRRFVELARLAGRSGTAQRLPGVRAMLLEPVSVLVDAAAVLAEAVVACTRISCSGPTRHLF